MAIHTKYVGNLLTEDIRREVHLQRLASSMEVSPKIIHSDYQTVIHMEDVSAMCIADVYGDELSMIPDWIQEQIVEHLWTLYSCCQIQYVDITPYNFIERNGRVWVIDFGHAYRNRPKAKLHPFLKRIFDTWKLSQWNPEFK